MDNYHCLPTVTKVKAITVSYAYKALESKLFLNWAIIMINFMKGHNPSTFIKFLQKCIIKWSVGHGEIYTWRNQETTDTMLIHYVQNAKLILSHGTSRGRAAALTQWWFGEANHVILLHEHWHLHSATMPT